MVDGSSWNEEYELVTAKGKNIWVNAIGKTIFRHEKCIKIQNFKSKTCLPTRRVRSDEYKKGNS